MEGNGTQENPYRIYDVDDLQAMENDITAYYELGQDIDASATVGWNGGLGFDPIMPAFKGNFDGKGFSITGLFINRPLEAGAGLFGQNSSTPGVIVNVHLIDCDITGKFFIGALVGNNSGSITGCTSSGVIEGAGHLANTVAGGLVGRNATSTSTNTRCSSSCSVALNSSVRHAGGLAGTNSGVISECYATGNVEASLASGRAGGLVAINDGTIDDSYSRGNATGVAGAGGFMCYNSVAAATVNNCYSTGIPSAAATGGFCELDFYFHITNCFWDTETSGQATSGGGTGKTTAQMKTASTFTDAGWDFSGMVC